LMYVIAKPRAGLPLPSTAVGLRPNTADTAAKGNATVCGAILCLVSC